MTPLAGHAARPAGHTSDRGARRQARWTHRGAGSPGRAARSSYARVALRECECGGLGGV